MPSEKITGRANGRNSPTLTSVSGAGQSSNRTGLIRTSAKSYVRNRTGTPKSPFVKRQGGWAEYSKTKNAWIAAHPNASAAEIDREAKRIAERLGL